MTRRTLWPFVPPLAAVVVASALSHAQTVKPTSPRAFATFAAAVKRQAETLTARAKDQAERARMALAERQAVRDLKQREIEATNQEIAAMRAQAAARFAIAMEIAAAEMQMGIISIGAAATGAASAAPHCASETQGVKPKIIALKRTVDGVVGSTTSEMTVARADEKKQTAPKLKQILAAYAKDLQSIASLASSFSTALAKLESQAATLPPCE